MDSHVYRDDDTRTEKSLLFQAYFKSMHERLVHKRDGWCASHPYEWPGWVGGNPSFLDNNQNYGKLIMLRKATMLEF